MPTVFPNSVLDGVDEGLGLTQALAKEGLKFFLGDWGINLILHLLLILLLAKQGGIFEEGGDKWHPILIFGPGGGKIVLILLEKVIVLQVSFIPIYV